MLDKRTQRVHLANLKIGTRFWLLIIKKYEVRSSQFYSAPATAVKMDIGGMFWKLKLSIRWQKRDLVVIEIALDNYAIESHVGVNID